MNRLALVLLTLILSAVLQSSIDAAAAPILLGDAPSYPLAGHLEQLVDPAGKLTLGDLLAPKLSARFSPIPGNLNRSYTRDTVWLRFTMQRSATFSEQGYLRLGPQFLDSITIHIQTGSNPADPDDYRTIQAGDHTPLDGQAPLSSDYLIPFTLVPDTPCTVYLRVQSTSAVTLAGSIHTPASIISFNNLSILLNGGYLAVALVIGLINLVVFLRLRDRLFLYFALYILALFITHIGMAGFLPLLLPGQAHLLSDYLTGGGLGLATAVFTPFAICLFRLQPGSWLHRYFIFQLILGCLVMLSVPFDFYGAVAPVTLIALLATIILLVGLSIREVRRKEPGALLYLAAFGVSNIGYTVHFMRLLGVLPIAWWNLHGVQIASLMNMVLMTLALTERVHAAEQMALGAARNAEGKALELADEMTRELRHKQHDLEEALENEHRALEQKSRFLAMLSHEYRTPLAIIQANLDLLELQQLEHGQPPEPRHGSMRRAVRRLVEVMETSLNKDRLEAPEPYDATQLIALHPFLDEVIDEAEGFWSDRLFVFQPAGSSPLVEGDPGQLKTALLNLLDNACKYSPPETVVTITCRTDSEMAVVTVADQGSGISPGEAETIFEKFRRGSASQGTSGAGLGLWLVRQIIEQQGGDITLAPGAEKGTIATIGLPLSAYHRLCQFSSVATRPKPAHHE